MPAIPAAVPANEAERLATLQRLEILDTVPEQAYDDLTLLASQVCGTPIALVTLADADRQWFKSAIGVAATGSARDLAFCAHAILKPDEVFIVEDTALDARFTDNPRVTGEPHVRFYAGAPIVMSGGEAVGTMCVIDTLPRTLTDAQRRCLAALARQASALLDLREKAATSQRLAEAHEQMSVEALLKQKRGMDLLELVLRGDRMGLWDLHVPTGIWTVNAREHAMLGYADVESRPENLDWKALVHPDDRAALNEAMASHLNDRAPYYESTHRMRHADGTDIWVLERGVIVERDVRGDPIRIVGTHVDITEARRVEEARLRDAERLALALSGGDHGLWDWHVPSGRVVRNEHWARMFGYTLAETEMAYDADGLWRSIVHPDDRIASEAVMDRHFRGETSQFEAEVRMRHKDGRTLWVLDRAKVVERDAAGNAVRVVGTNMNITERKANEHALQRATELLVRTGRMARVGGWEIESEHRGILWSDEVYRILDVDPDERPALDQAMGFVAPESRAVLTAAIEAGFANGTGWDLELPLVTAHGRSVWIRTIGSAEWQEGRVVRLCGAVQDITDRKEAELRRADTERQLRLITDSLPALIARVDANERYTFVNETVVQVFGIERASLLGKTMREVRPAKAYESMAPHIARALAGELVSFEDYAEIRGRAYFYQTTYVPDVDADGHVNGFFAMTLDLTERKRAETRRAESDDRLRGITDNLPVLIAEIDPEGRFRFVNATYRTWLGVEPDSVIGRHVSETMKDEVYAGRRAYLERACAGETVSFEQTLRLPSGERCLQTTYLPHHDAGGAVAGVYALTSDITELKQTQRELDKLARFDPLTGLANRLQFEERLNEAMARTRRSGIALGVLYLDIDRFKTINDTLGHAAGDAVLVEVAERLKHAVRTTDLVARHAGDEFVVILEGIVDAAEARGVADKLVLAMRTPFTVRDHPLSVTTSVGVATFDGGPMEPATLLSQADRALYDAKAQGRDRVGVAPPG